MLNSEMLFIVTLNQLQKADTKLILIIKTICVPFLLVMAAVFSSNDRQELYIVLVCYNNIAYFCYIILPICL